MAISLPADAADGAAPSPAVADDGRPSSTAAAATAHAASRSAPSPAASPVPPPQPGSTPVPAPATDAVARLDWHSLRAAVDGCRACPLATTRTHTVFGTGSTAARWMVVGEAPGEQEDRAGEPFIGPAGQLLDRMLAALALTRSPDAPPQQAVYIANTLKCRPPRNRNPQPDEMACCAPFLQRQIELLQPRVILAMGRFALQSLLGSDEPVGRLRGRVHTVHDVPLVVTYHPAYLLRNPAEKARAWDDLCLAADVVEGAGRP